MRRGKGEVPFLFGLGWRKFLHFLLVGVLLCVVFISLEVPKLLRSVHVPDNVNEDLESEPFAKLVSTAYKRHEDTIFSEVGMTKRHVTSSFSDARKNDPKRPNEDRLKYGQSWTRTSDTKPFGKVQTYGRIPRRIKESRNGSEELLGLEKLAAEAWQAGYNMCSVLQNSSDLVNSSNPQKQELCLQTIVLSSKELQALNNLVLLPCGILLGSSITVVGTPHPAHVEYLTKVYRNKIRSVTATVSQFAVELQGLKVVDNEEPPRILHVNPRLKGDWSGEAVFEMNTCYRGQWGIAQRCSGVESPEEDETVDGLLKCEKWVQDNENNPAGKKSTWWLGRLIGHTEKPGLDWQYPFVENQSFVLTIRAGWEGYHVSVDGRHIASSPYRTGFALEDATGLAIKGDIDVHFVMATSLPLSHPILSPQEEFEMSERWKAPELLSSKVDFFIGILSASNHVVERMAIRKTWMQSKPIRTSKVIARFFVALHASMDVNLHLKKEADFYGDIVVVPFVDRYELLVLKTVAVCEYAIWNTSANYIMKCDDDNFVHLEAVLSEVTNRGQKEGLYLGNINVDHRPLRQGKWAVTYEEWPEEEYPPYANGPGYIITRDIATFVLSQHQNHSLRLFKMEDVSMGMWVAQYSLSNRVHYQHSWKFCQFGCIEGYYTSHYQSPRQMLCMWEKLSQGKVECCNMK